ncbi:MAG: PEP-CTERM sorting domain-containing protein [Verrucomicrobia bacterium]|nr:PEP-CTERM sorting domain-containing protein [Verrucomicrobiota bacterium]NBU69082.1 PEP-CTERM sorting domain-containing protein [Verrucomicrobiota bacterium]
MRQLLLLCLLMLQVNLVWAANLALTFDQPTFVNGATGTWTFTGQMAADTTGAGGTTYGDIGFVYDYHNFGTQYGIPGTSNLPGNCWLSFSGLNGSGTATDDATTYAINPIGIWALIYPSINVFTLSIYLDPYPIPDFRGQVFEINASGNFIVSNILGTSPEDLGVTFQNLEGTYENQINNDPARSLVISVPEPSALSLLAVGLGVVLRRRRRTV